MLVSGCCVRHVKVRRQQPHARSASAGAIPQLMKKFMFHVHPDYFHNYKAIQSVNATNWTILQGLVEQKYGSSSVSGEATDLKSLTFYLKPAFDNAKPQKVKVSTSRIERSIIEILETIGVEVPLESDAQANEAAKTAHSTVMASAEQTLEFLQSMYERRSLMQVRASRKTDLTQLERDLLELTGAARVSYRNSWSAPNNALLVAKLLDLIRRQQSALDLPWTDMTIVFSKGVYDQRINYLEREIILTYADVPEELTDILRAVRREAIAESAHHVEQIHRLQQAFESAATVITSGALGQQQRADAASRQGGDTPQPSTRVKVSIHKGFTCSTTNFYYFLYMMNKEKLIFDRSTQQLTLTQDGGSADRYHNEDSSQHSIDVPPLPLRITIEDSHGTRILEDGNFRVDVRADAATVLRLLTKGSADIALLAAQHQQRQDEIRRLCAQLQADLGILKFVPGIGVTDEQFLDFLRRLDVYRRDSTTREALLQLKGLNLTVGHYLGITDEGGCILPWELSLPVDEN